ncbi:MAG: hypothetical protein JWP97_1479 [Labilithrix sp.]|nr:hypothetical protein [Labilithrix sp.]
MLASTPASVLGGGAASSSSPSPLGLGPCGPAPGAVGGMGAAEPGTNAVLDVFVELEAPSSSLPPHAASVATPAAVTSQTESANAQRSVLG